MSIIMNDPFYSFSHFNYLSTFKTAALILTIILTVVLFVTLLNNKDNEDKKGFKGFLYNFLHFNTFCIDKVIKVLYVLQLSYNLVYGCLLLFVNPVKGLMYIVVYNLILRLVLEFIMAIIDIKKSTDRKCGCHKQEEKEIYIEDVNLDEEFDEENATIIDANDENKEE